MSAHPDVMAMWERAGSSCTSCATPCPPEFTQCRECRAETQENAAPPNPTLYDDLVRDVIAGLMPLRTIYGLAVTDEAMSDRAANIVQGIVNNYNVSALPGKRVAT